MAKLALVLIAVFANNVVFAEIYRWDQDANINNIGKYTRDLVEILKTDYDQKTLRFLKNEVEKLVTDLGAKHYDDDTVLEIENKLQEFLASLKNPLAVPQLLIECLDDIWKIFNSDFRQHNALAELANEYCHILERTHALLTKKFNNASNPKEEVEDALTEIIKYLEAVSFDNDFVRQTVLKLLHNYIYKLEMVSELKNKINCLKVVVKTDFDPRNLKKCLDMYLMFVKESHFEDYVYMHLLPPTRTLQFNIYNTCYTKIPLGETTRGFENQIHTVATGLIKSINAITVTNKVTQNILNDLVREFISDINIIKRKLKMHNIAIEMDVVIDVNTMDVDAIKTRLINAVRESAINICSILRHQPTNEIYGIVSDFLAILQRQTMQIQNIYQNIIQEVPVEELAMQIQTITNGILLYLRNVPTNDVMIREKLEVQVHHLVKRLQAALDRVHQVDDDDFTKTIRKIRKVTDNFEDFMGKSHMYSIQEVVFYFDILAQDVAAGMKRLAWTVKSKEALTGVVKKLFSEYLVIIENIQVKIQRINQVAQVGESPEELALQIQALSDHLRKLLLVSITDHPLTKKMLTWQVRGFNQVLEVIVIQLHTKMITETGTIYREVSANLKNIQESLRTYMDNPNVYQIRVIIGTIIDKASQELIKLTLTSQSDIEEGHGVQTIFVRSLLTEFLLALQDFHMQVQYNFQIVLSGQSPFQILREIGTLSHQILNLLEESDPKMETVLAMQLGEYVQTIENALNLLHHKMKNNGEHDVEQEKMSDMLGKMSLILQNVHPKDVYEVKKKLEASMQKFLNIMQELVKMNMEKVKMEQVGSTHTNTLHGILSNMLSTMRNMYLQIQHAKHEPKYESTNEILNQIASISNNIMPALETIVGSTTPVKQALDLQVFKYARELKTFAKKLDAVSDVEIKTHVEEALMTLEQTASSLTTLTINEIKLHLNNLVQGVSNEVQKIDKRELLIEYLMSLKYLHVQIQVISRMSHQSENYQLIGMLIDSAVIELRKTLQNLPPQNKLIAKAIVLESHELSQLIANVINRYQAASVLQNDQLLMEIASELKTIQLHLQEVTVREVYEKFDKVVVDTITNVEKATALIEELMVMPTTQSTVAEYRPDLSTFVKVTLHDFLTAIQNMVIQIESIVVYETDTKLTIIDKLSHHKMTMPGALYHVNN
ncbi:hypothetical protein RN001_010991 [Aquatica leii]|uniref:Uncharacterized protein n=1 Tax=Aquatica leii TaxID=1421715 RepID=A0AAN7P1R5_9COLE|nr:hypothetical protein RN001_010991 [Aquatica leii]